MKKLVALLTILSGLMMANPAKAIVGIASDSDALVITGIAMMDISQITTMMIPIFRYGSIAAFLQALFLILNIIHLYFKDTKPVLINYAFFMVSNFLLSWLSLVLDFRFWGLGYLLSTLMTLVLSFVTLNKTLISLNLFTFMRQPLTQKNYSEEL